MSTRQVRQFMASMACVGILAAWSAEAQAQNESEEQSGKVSSVIIYQGQALVTREVELPAGNGLREIVVTGLPQHVVPSSIYAEPAEGVEIRSVRYRVRPVREDVREEVRVLDQQLQELHDELAAIQKRFELLNERKAYLSKLEGFTAQTSSRELTEGVLNPPDLMQVTEFLFQQRQQIAEEELENTRQQRDLQKQCEVVQQKRALITGRSTRQAREALVFVDAEDGQAARIRLRYLVDRASWTPSYVIRAEEDGDSVQLDYFASIQQMSGEDWNNVEMVLSTATPSLVSKAPALDPLAIRLAQASQLAQAREGLPAPDADYLTNKMVLDEELKQAFRARNFAANGQVQQDRGQQATAGYGGGGYGSGYGASGYGGYGAAGGTFPPGHMANSEQRQAEVAMNTVANQLQLLDLMNEDSLETAASSDKADTEGISVSYQLANHTSLPSRADHQLLQINSFELKGDFYRLAIPVLTSYIYKEADLVNDSQQVLLAGAVSTFVGDQFVGRGELPTVAMGERFSVGLGIDSSLRVGRELVQKEETIQGGNRVVDFTYRLLLENFSEEDARVRLLDRLPVAEEADVKLTLVSTDREISEDPAYQMADRKQGILRWDVAVPSRAMGHQRAVFDYTMRLEYDKQMAIAGLPLRR